MKGILKSRPSTPAPSDSSVGEKSKELADKALNLINPARKYKKRRRELFKALAWWEDEVENPDLSLDLDSTPGRRKILFEDRIRRRRASLESSVRRVVILASDWSTLGHVIQYYWTCRSSTCTSTPKSQGGGIGGKLRSSIGSSSRSGQILVPDWSDVK